VNTSNIFLICLFTIAASCSPDIGEDHYYQHDPPPGSHDSATGGAAGTGGSLATGGSPADTGGQEATGGAVQIIIN
jgi:hypothetical protein